MCGRAAVEMMLPRDVEREAAEPRGPRGPGGGAKLMGAEKGWPRWPRCSEEDGVGRAVRARNGRGWEKWTVTPARYGVHDAPPFC